MKEYFGRSLIFGSTLYTCVIHIMGHLLFFVRLSYFLTKFDSTGVRKPGNTYASPTAMI